MKWLLTPVLAVALSSQPQPVLADALSLRVHRREARRRSLDPLRVEARRQEDADQDAEEAAAEEDADPGWTSKDPDSTDYNEETHVSFLPMSVETMIAGVFCLLIASAPILLAGLAEEQLTRAHMLESVALIAWLGGALFLFTNVLKFQSSHWDGFRPLTLVEAVYLLAQILTTVGYGDITPAFPRGQVWVGFNVIVALCLYGSIVSEVTDIVHQRVQKAFKAPEDRSLRPAQQLKDWDSDFVVDKSGLVKSAASFAALATIGVFFWHYYPGEDKTWLQAVYMSVITLSTVGFGAFNALTEGGKVFGAFWMLFGVASLGALVGSFIELMLKEKAAEQKRVSDLDGEFARILKLASGGAQKMDKLQFLKFGLMLTKGKSDTNWDETFRRIEMRFKNLQSDSSSTAISRSIVVDREGPVL